MRQIAHFIDGPLVAGTSGRFGDIFNPNTGEVQARVALASAAEVDAAVRPRPGRSRPGPPSIRSAARG